MLVTVQSDLILPILQGKYRLLANPKKVCIFPILDIFPNLRILLGFILKLKRHRLYPQNDNKITGSGNCSFLENISGHTFG